MFGGTGGNDALEVRGHDEQLSVSSGDTAGADSERVLAGVAGVITIHQRSKALVTPVDDAIGNWGIGAKGSHRELVTIPLASLRIDVLQINNFEGGGGDRGGEN